MILLDSSVLVALCDRSDPLTERASAQLRSVDAARLRVTAPILTETWHLLDGGWLRTILVQWLAQARVPVVSPVEERGAFGDVWRWLEKYEDHDPDFADAYLVIACTGRGHSIWTYDSEFVKVWRRLDGSRIPLTFPLADRSTKARLRE